MERISPHQFTMLSAGVLLGTTFFPVAQLAAGAAGRDAWWCVLPAYSLGIPFGLMIYSLMGKYPGKNLLQISEITLGKWAGKTIGIIYILISAYFGALLLSQVADAFRRSVLPFIPVSVYWGGVILLVILLAWGGIEVFARFTEIVFPTIVLGLVATFLLAIPRFEWEEFYPVLGNGLKPVFWGTLKIAPFPMEYILFLAGVLTFLPAGEQDKRQLKTGIWRSIIIVGVLNTMVTLTEIMVFGPTETQRLNYGLLSLGKMIEFAKTFAGVESIFMLVWMGAMIIKVGALFFMAFWGMQSVFHIRRQDWKWYFLLGGAFLVLASLPEGGVELLTEITYVDDYLILPFTVSWVLLVWGVERWRKGVSKQ